MLILLAGYYFFSVDRSKVNKNKQVSKGWSFMGNLPVMA